MNELLQLATSNPYFNTVTTIVTLASVVAAVTPTPKPGTKLAKAYKLVDLLALNILKAKEK